TTGAGGLCTGSVIGPYAIMTAKHCVFEGSRPLASSQFLVLVGSDIQSMGGVESFHPVIEIRTTAGTDISADIENGNDIAILLLDAPIGVPAIPIETGAPVTGAAVTVVGFGRTMTGVPSPTDSGVKYRGTTRVDRVGSRIFETVGSSWTCQGDSGGPVWNTASGRIIGITSFGIGERCMFRNSYFSRVDIHRSLIADALSYAPVCAPETEVCDGVDNDCNGMVDEGCTPLGEPCSSDGECARGGCEDVDGTRVCVRDCDPTDAIRVLMVSAPRAAPPTVPTPTTVAPRSAAGVTSAGRGPSASTRKTAGSWPRIVSTPTRTSSAPAPAMLPGGVDPASNALRPPSGSDVCPRGCPSVRPAPRAPIAEAGSAAATSAPAFAIRPIPVLPASTAIRRAR
ncbi:MAG: trypsin-like serine protease, partial [Deltaproteobacteria bacterium]|nr:trypsin-like serine protease [Deltaproteobacteria bacterium]